MLKDGEYPRNTDPDGFPSRLREALDSYGSTSSVARAINRSEGAVRKWLRGQSEPSVSDLRAICELTHTNIEWLVFGRGSRQGDTGRQEFPPYAPLPPIHVKLLDKVVLAVDLKPVIGGRPVTPAQSSSIMASVYNMSRLTGEVDEEIARRIAELPGESRRDEVA
jgi:transcriptional regulator with XRE-family HTH domain